MKKNKLIILILLFLLILVGCKKTTYTDEQVDAVVVEKYFKDQYTTTVPTLVGKSILMMPRIFPERYELHVQYEGITEVIDNKELYEKYEKGDTIKMYLKTEIKAQRLYLK